MDGVHPGQLHGGCYVSVHHGIWSVREAPVQDGPGTSRGLNARLPALMEVFPDGVLSHLTAAILLGFRLPHRVLEMARIHLSQPGAKNPPRGRNFVGHRLHLTGAQIWRAGGFPVTAPARTLVDLAAMKTRGGRYLFAEDDLVALVDGVINEHATGFHAGRLAQRSKSALTDDLDELAGHRGVARVRRAVGRAVVGVDSVLETRARLLLEDHGLTGWVTDVELTVRGHRSVWPDLADPQHRIALQIEGAHHDERGQRVRDIERHRATEAAGWIEIRVVAADLVVGPTAPAGSVPRLIQLVRQARARSLA